MVLCNIYALNRDRQVRGVQISPTLFFFIWGIWNLYYYPHLNQWFSFLGGIAIVVTNGIWCAQAFYYTYDRRCLNCSHKKADHDARYGCGFYQWDHEDACGCMNFERVR